MIHTSPKKIMLTCVWALLYDFKNMMKQVKNKKYFLFFHFFP